MCYTVKKASGPVRLDGDFDSDIQWKNANTAELSHVLHKNTDFAGKAAVKMLYDDSSIYGLFRVHDRYVRVVRTGYQQSVCKDSCVEFFVQPPTDDRYLNFEFSGGGAMLLTHIKHCRSGNLTPVPDEDCGTIERFHTLPSRVDPEITEPVTWRLGFRIPIAFFVKYSAIDPELSGQIWRGNFYKCCDETSHPHWLTWKKMPRLDFHIPECFGELHFEYS